MKFKTMPDNSGGGAFLKMKDGDDVKVVFFGEFVELWKTKYVAGVKSEIVPEGTEGARWVFRSNVAVKIDGQVVAKIFEGGPEIGGKLEKIGIDYKILDTVIKISRVKAKNRTSWEALPMPDGVHPSLRESISQLKPYDLREKKNSETSDFMNSPMPDFDSNEEEIPF